MFRISRYKPLITALLTVLVVYYILRRHLRRYPSEEIQCYYAKNATLEDFTLTDRPTEKSIFFLETSCTSHRLGKISIKARQACAVESAARLNPNYEVYLLYVSPGTLKLDEMSESDRFLQVLLSYGNVKIRHIDFDSYLQGSIVENLSLEHKLNRSFFPIQHASDILRFLTLWKYGGIYLDLDTLVIKSLEVLPPNFSGAESGHLVASAILSFSAEGVGHDLATLCLEDIRDNFDGDQWAQNGPDVITRLVHKVCNTQKVSEAVDKACYGQYRVFPTLVLNPVPWQEWYKYFEERYNQEVDVLTQNSYVLHLWNKLSGKRRIKLDQDVAYARFARQYCPKVFDECEEYF